MSELLNLRPYQEEAVTALEVSELQRPAVVLPTGTGKTVIFSHLARRHLGTHGTRVMILVHRDELADQALSKLHAVAPHLRLGKVKASDNETGADVMVCSVQTLARKSRLDQLLAAERMLGKVGLVIVDECHHAAADSYLTVLRELGCFGDDSRTRAMGFTATLARGDGVGLGSVWEDVVYSRTVLRMIAEGYLVDVRGQSVSVEDLDLSKVRRTGGDFAAGPLGRAFLDAGGHHVVAAALQKYASQRRSLVFCPDVFSSLATAQMIQAAGIPCAVVHGKTPREERLLTYKQFREGELRAIVNCMVLTEGFDAPWADCAVIARPTQSAPLYVQMVGRVLRPHPGKDDALVIDITGSGGRLSTLVDLDPGVVVAAEPGESLAETYQRQEERADSAPPAGSLAFALKHRDLDLFAASSQLWLRTYGGALFVPTPGKGYIVLWPEGETWSVVHVPDQNRRWRRLHSGLPLGTAQAWAETESDALVPWGTREDAPWRRRTATVRQASRARGYGLTVPDRPSRGEIADMVNVHEASLLIDRFLVKVQGRG